MERPLPHSIELRALLVTNGCDLEITADAIECFDDFVDKWRDQTYRILGPPQDDGPARAAFRRALDAHHPRVEFIGLNDLRENDAELVGMLIIALSNPLSDHLLDGPSHATELDAGAKKTLQGRRRLKEILESNIGTRRLQQALDGSFGASFGRLVRHDIVAVWQCYFSYLLTGKAKDAERFLELIELVRNNPVIGRRDDTDGGTTWLLWSA